MRCFANNHGLNDLMVRYAVSELEGLLAHGLGEFLGAGVDIIADLVRAVISHLIQVAAVQLS